MAINKKPITEQMRIKAISVYRFLQANKNRYCTKEEISNFMGGLNERTIRDIINWLRNKHVMVISTSSGKGYKLADLENKTDIEEVKHMLYELESRKLEIESVQKCCDKFLKQAKA